MNKAQMQFLGILNRGKLLSFGPSLGKSPRRIGLLLLASDASENTKSTVASLSRLSHCQVVVAGDKAELGKGLGYQAISAIAILDKKAAKAFLEKGEQA